MELQCVICGSVLIGTENMLAHIQESHPPTKVMANPGGLMFRCEYCADACFSKSQQYDEHFINTHVFCKVGDELVRPDLTPIPGGAAAAAAAAAAVANGTRAIAEATLESTTAINAIKGQEFELVKAAVSPMAHSAATTGKKRKP